ncbi:hypothetical protein ACED56_13835 [Vibrio splendidus]|uniref:hypothetical protein n=1 Tax=Vibrio splendidus TaxID=29497 RepID=UPI00352C67D8
MKPLKVFLLVATSIFLCGCAGGPIRTATKFTSYKDFSTMIDSLDDAKDAINYWVERLGDTLRHIDDA